MLQFRDIEKLQTINLRWKRVKRVLTDGSLSITWIRYGSAKIQTVERLWAISGMEWRGRRNPLLN